jgi:hypothetical protein
MENITNVLTLRQQLKTKGAPNIALADFTFWRYWMIMGALCIITGFGVDEWRWNLSDFEWLYPDYKVLADQVRSRRNIKGKFSKFGDTLRWEYEYRG